MKKTINSTPVLGFLFALNLAVAILGVFVLDGSQQIVTCTGMGVVSLGAGAALLGKYRSRRADLAAPGAVAA